MAITLDISGQADGTFTIEDDGIPGNGTSVVRRPNGTILSTFAHPSDALTIISRPGQTVIFNVIDSLTTANVTIGSLTTPGQRPDAIENGGVLTSGVLTLTAQLKISEFGADAATDLAIARQMCS